MRPTGEVISRGSERPEPPTSSALTTLARPLQVVRRRGVRSALRRGVERLLRPILVPLAARRLQKEVGRARTIDEALDLAYGFRFGGIVFDPWQRRSEIHALLTAVRSIRPERIVEIGTSNGGTLFLFARVAAPDALLISVDLPGGEFGGGYPRWRGVLYRAFALPTQHIRLLRADSHDTATASEVAADLDGEAVDFLFIDGDHTYEGVKRDFELYGALVRTNGLIAFHDIVPTNRDGSAAPKGTAPDGDLYLGGEVPEFWRELKETHDVEEFVDDWNSGVFGIGLLRKTAQDPSP